MERPELDASWEKAEDAEVIPFGFELEERLLR